MTRRPYDINSPPALTTFARPYCRDIKPSVASPKIRKVSPFVKAPTFEAWRAWLRRHHGSERVVWLVFPKRTAAPSVSYGDALDEALCWGWIDSIVKRIDDASYARKFTPRTNWGKWSTVNVNRLKSLLAAGRVQPPGLAVISSEVMERIQGRSAEPKRPKFQGSDLRSPELETALSMDARARAFFKDLAPSYRRNYIAWVSTAKQPATRLRRAEEAVKLLARGIKALLK